MSVKKAYIARNIEEVLDILNKEKEKAKILAGGTDVLVKIRNKAIEPEILIDITKIKELRFIKEENGFIEIGAASTFTDIVKSEIFENNLYGFKKACKLVGSPQIRNKGTIGGNIINGSSAADSIPPLLCLEAVLVYRSKDSEREVSLEEFYTDKENKNIRQNELLTEIRFKRPEGRLSFSKLGLRKALAIARISNSILLKVEEGKIVDAKVASGALGLYPLRERTVEDYLIGKSFDNEVKEEAFKLLQEAMRERLEGRSTFPYKKVAVEHTFKEALEEVM